MSQWDRQTDRHQTVAIRLPLAVDAASVIIIRPLSHWKFSFQKSSKIFLSQNRACSILRSRNFDKFISKVDCSLYKFSCKREKKIFEIEISSVKWVWKLRDIQKHNLLNEYTTTVTLLCVSWSVSTSVSESNAIMQRSTTVWLAIASPPVFII